ncbi:leucine efflux protein LeuE [Nonomuraea glycinis]|jgi:leucine efflux protein|uniref:Leucine efflux protein n=1 Tax=Nonomuraea glycinis TaxID=2047744 RepID=A0A918E3N3_9ACTN|nr:leucine efflux protein LeuE [Nonomuraea glycinis]MCA2183272.1 leucine efflux protein LeuE [Nonomuraea glycinis]WSG63820.1 leucine efflux protein LeuE [Nonomuraea glycinis]GGP04415.1 leucine efflux protein [Nonomuraea glycinis]
MFFGITDIWTYVIGAFLIILLPGPNSLYVLALSAQRGVRQGYRAAAGVFVGDAVLMALAAAGAASLLRSSPVLFAIVKYAGAAYLAWIGFQMLRGAWQAWRTRPEGELGQVAATAVMESDRPGSKAVRPFRKALTISLLNPKAILFFVSFFIQFVDPGYAAPALSFLILGAIIQVFSLLYLSALIFGGSFLAAQFRTRRRLSAGLTSGVGALFLGFGAKLATTSLG